MVSVRKWYEKTAQEEVLICISGYDGEHSGSLPLHHLDVAEARIPAKIARTQAVETTGESSIL